MDEVTWLREGYAHKSAEVGYLAAEADRLKWLYDQSVHQVSLLKSEIEKLTKKLEDVFVTLFIIIILLNDCT